MKKIFSITVMVFILFYCLSVSAMEHGGKEHDGKEHGGEKVKTQPAAEEIKDTMKNYIMDKSKKTGAFEIVDPQTGKMRNLQLKRIHERVGKTGDYYYSCADFKDTKSGELLDLDIDVEYKSENLKVVDVRIHKVEGKERYTYDKNDNRIPVK